MDPHKLDQFGNRYSLARTTKPIHVIYLGVIAVGTLFYVQTDRRSSYGSDRGKLLPITYPNAYAMARDLGVTQVWVDEFELVTPNEPSTQLPHDDATQAA